MCAMGKNNKPSGNSNGRVGNTKGSPLSPPSHNGRDSSRSTQKTTSSKPGNNPPPKK